MTPRKLRVLAFIEAYVLTGPAKNLIEFSSRAAGLPGGAGITLATFERPTVTENRFTKAAAQSRVPVCIIPEKGPFDPAVIVRMRRLARDLRPDIVQTHSVKSHFLMMLSGVWRATPWIAFHHGYTVPDWKMRLYNQLDRASLLWPRKIVTVCGPFAAELRAQGVGAGRIAIVHNGVKPFVPPPPETVEALRTRLNLPGDVPLIVAIGRLSREKGHADLIEALAIVRRNAPDLRFQAAIAGEGHERAALERRIAELHLQAHAVLCGHQHDVAPFYAAASIVVLPSHSEGSPNVLLEAQAAGVPAIAATVGGVPEIASDGINAVLVPPHDPATLAAAIERLLRDPAFGRALADAGRNHVLARFTPETQMASILGLYREVVKVASDASI